MKKYLFVFCFAFSFLSAFEPGILNLNVTNHTYEYGEKKYEYTGDLSDKNRRMKEKLYNLWKFWAEIRSANMIEELLFRRPEDEQSDEYLAKQIIVNIIDTVNINCEHSNVFDTTNFVGNKNVSKASKVI